jgi:membrane-associated phospholipid phosphatase
MPSIAARAGLLLALGAALSARTGHAETPPATEFTAPPPDSLWHSEWPTFSGAEAAATVAAGVGTAVLFVLKPPTDPRWEGGILFDDAVRRKLRLRSAHARQQVRDWGDMPYFAAPAIPLIIDPLLVSWLGRGDAKTAFNLEAVGLEAFSYAGLMSYVSTRSSVRERPDSSECRRTHTDPKACGEPDTESFYSGHTTIAAASAGIVCANHRVMPLWGRPWADAGACVLATAGAVASGVSRLASDRHYASDVIVGFGAGFGFGYAVPTLLHYARNESNVALSLVPGGPCTGACVKLTGTF